MEIAKHRVARIDYVLTGPDGAVIDSSEGRGPLVYLHGMGHLIAGLEQELEGCVAGESFEVDIAPAEAYGDHDPRLIEVIDRGEFGPAAAELEVGMQFRADSPAGPQVVTITEIAGDDVTVDGNHPLAGTPLHFAVTVVHVRDATAEEIAHGHVHDGDEHDHG